jgi:hypothetical protein
MTSSEQVIGDDDRTFERPFLEMDAQPGQTSTPMDWNSSDTMEFQNYPYEEDEDDEEDPKSPFPPSYLDRNDMPSTRENSPEPYWRNTFGRTAGRKGTSPARSTPTISTALGQTQPRHLLANAQCSGGLNQHAQPYPMMFVVPKPMFVPNAANVMLPMSHGGVMPFPVQTAVSQQPAAHLPRGMPGVAMHEPAAAQRAPLPASSLASPPERKEQKEQKEQTEQKEQKGQKEQKERKERKDRKERKEQDKESKRRGRGAARGGSALDEMSEEQKEALCKYIYDVMVQKELTNADGYLVVDVFSEVWKDVGDAAGEREGWRVAQHRFADLLRAAPQYFRLFRRSIRVSNQCGWFTRKGEKMVRLVLQNEK